MSGTVTCMAGDLAAVERRHRRLKRLKDSQEVEKANAALQLAWNSGLKPSAIRLRPELVSSARPVPAAEPVPPPVTQLLNPRGIALRFYLIAVFEAHCRLAPGKRWAGTRRLQGLQGWTNFVAVDAAFSSVTGTYLRETKQERDAETSRLRQLQGALRTLEDVGVKRVQALVEVPKKANGRGRDYEDFRLMGESGRGPLHTPNLYSVPRPGDDAIAIPPDFFLRGWAHVLSPAEMATWLALQELSQTYPARHEESGVYLYAKRRKEQFGLLRDSYEDSCNTLEALGLIREVPQTRVVVTDKGPVEVSVGTSDSTSKLSFLYKPCRYQMIDEGLAADALDKTTKELIIRKHALERRQKNRE